MDMPKRFDARPSWQWVSLYMDMEEWAQSTAHINSHQPRYIHRRNIFRLPYCHCASFVLVHMRELLFQPIKCPNQLHTVCTNIDVCACIQVRCVLYLISTRYHTKISSPHARYIHLTKAWMYKNSNAKSRHMTPF